MNETLAITVCAGLAYLVGATPIGFVVARLVRGIDIREAGSGNIGATNVARVLGKSWGLLVLALDALKGAAPVLVLPALLLPAESSHLLHARVLTAVAAIVGHTFPVWLAFRGGKGVATALGVAIVLSPWASLAAAVTFISVVAAARYVSLGSLTASAAFAITAIALLWPEPFANSNWSLTAFAIVVPILIAVRHRANIGRLLAGTENRFGARALESAEEQSSSTTAEDEPAETVEPVSDG